MYSNDNCTRLIVAAKTIEDISEQIHLQCQLFGLELCDNKTPVAHDMDVLVYNH